jgi:hypothetical protein
MAALRGYTLARHSKLWEHNVKFYIGIAAAFILSFALFSGPSHRAAPLGEVNFNASIADAARESSRYKVAHDASRSETGGFMDEIYEKVIRDAEKQYQMAGGTSVDRCVHAGMVAAAYSQAHKQQGYQSWKLREESDCGR